MKHSSALVSLTLSAFLGASPPASAAQIGTVVRVVCDGLVCGGSGGGSASPFLYRVKPNGMAVNWFEVGIEDDDLSHYGSFVHPAGWEVSIQTVARAHDELPSAHGAVTASAGTCPYVLRFAKTTGAAQFSTFEVGFSYDLGEPGFHDVHWKTSDGTQANWTFPVGTNKGPVHSPKRLNVLVIVLDDVGTDKLTMYDDLYTDLAGPPTAGTITPRLDALAAQGIRFRNYYTNPLCGTSRACLLTGRYAFRHGQGSAPETPTPGCVDAVPEPGEYCYKMLDEEVFLPELLRDGFTAGTGFTSGAFGKYHLSYWTPDTDPIDPLDRLEWHAIQNGFDRFFGHMENVGDEPGLDHYTWKKVQHDPLNGFPTPSVSVVSNQWEASVVRADAVEWINDQTQPFFAYVAFNPPHLPAQVPPLELLSPETQLALANCTTDCSLLTYAAMVEGVDAEIANLLDSLDPAKRANTMVFIVADNGTPPPFVVQPPHDPAHAKKTVYQLGVRVPMIVSGPLVPAAPAGGWKTDELVNSVDLWRTIARITGADEEQAFLALGVVPCTETWIDSQSFLPLLQAPLGSGPRDWAFAQIFGPNLEASDLCVPVTEHVWYDCLTGNGRAITDGEFKLKRKRSSNPCAAPVYDEELYWIGPIDRVDPDPDVGELTDFLPGPTDVLSGAAPDHADDALAALRAQMNALE